MQNFSARPRSDLMPLEARQIFALVLLALVAGFALLAGSTPIWFTLITVCVFGAPHNWMEFRYFLSKLPSRFGPLRPFFITAFSGVIILCLAEVWLMHLFAQNSISLSGARTYLLVWNEVLILWMFALSLLRYRSRSNSLPSAILANSIQVAAATAANMLSAQVFSLALTYLHPLLGLWILDRELRRTRKDWVATYHWSLLSVPLAVAALIWWLHDSQSLHLSNQLAGNLNGNVIGSQLFTDASTTMLLAVFGFLQMVHYGVWVIAIPIANQGWKRWRLNSLAILQKKPGLKPIFASAIALGILAVLYFWIGFSLDYRTTNQIYVTVATLHVLAEIPFIFWMCES